MQGKGQNFMTLQIAVIAILLLIPVHAFADSEFRIQERDIPPEHAETVRFLELIKHAEEPMGPFYASDAPEWDTSELMPFVCEEGIDFSDVNEFLVGHVAYESIKEQLAERKGKVFTTFAHVAYVYSIQYTQYSDLMFTDTDSGVTVNVSGWYRLDFVYKDGQPCLVGLHYDWVEID